MQAIYRLTTLSIFMLVCLRISAQDLVYKNFSIDDGLPSSEVYNSIQDSEGYMWFATDHGVCRYDGKEFRTFTTQDGLEDNVVFKVVRDQKKRIWFIPQKGGLTYYENGSIKKYRYNTMLQQLVYSRNNLITDIYIDRSERLWFTTRNWLDSSNSSLFCIDSKGKLQKHNTNIHNYDFHYFFIKEIEDSYLASMYLIQKPNPKKAGSPINYRYDAANKLHTICRFDFDGMVKCVKTRDHLYIGHIDKAGGNWLRCIELSSGKTDLIPIDKTISALYIEDSTIYIGTISGLKISTVRKLLGKKAPDTYLRNIFISNICKDHEGNIWITSLNNGIYSIYQSKLLNIVNEDDKLYSITFLRELNNSIYYGTSNHKLYRLNEGEPELIVDYGKDKTLIKWNISDIAQIDKQLLLSNLSTSKDSKKWLNNPSLELYSTQHQFFIKKFLNINDTLVCCLNSGFAILHKNKVIFHSEEIGFNKKITSATYDENTRCIYLGSTDGVYQFPRDSRKIRELSLRVPGQSSGKISVSDILSRKGHLYIASKEEGLIIYSIAKNDVVSNHINEFRTPMINCLVLDSNFLWIGTNKGLHIAQLNAKQIPRRFEYYNKSDGLPSNEITRILIYRNMAYISSKTEIFFCPLYSINKVRAQAPLIVDSFSANNFRYRITESGTELNAEQNNISIPLKGIFFRNNSSYKYKYSVFRDEKNIIPETNIYEDNIRLVELKAGAYSIYVWTTNKEGINSDPKIVRFSIAKPFTRTIPFIATVILSGGFIMFYLIRLLIRSRTEKEKRNRLVLIAEQKALRAQMNPHFIFNALNSIQYYIASKDHITGANFLSKFSRLIRSILENSSKGYITLAEELENLKLYLQLEKLRFEDDFSINLSINIKSDPTYIKIPSMMIQPFIENSIWHGLLPKTGEKEITVAFEETADSLRVSILDNGIGREASRDLNSTKRRGHQSQGLTNIEERIRLYNAAFKVDMSLSINDLTDDSGNCAGTEVLLVIPLLDQGP